MVNYKENQITQKFVARYLRITTRRYRQIFAIFEKSGYVSFIGIGIGRPKSKIPDGCKQIIDDEFRKYKLNALYFEKVIYREYNVRIPHNTIHQMLLEKGYAKTDHKKQKRRSPWIRYERMHSLSAIHLDWHLSKINGKWVCVAIDDASRNIVAWG